MKKIDLKTNLKAPVPAKQEEDTDEQATNQRLGVIKEDKVYPRSYRWRDDDMELLDRLSRKVNDKSLKKINATKILRAAMILADKAPIDKLLRAVVEGEAKGVL